MSVRVSTRTDRRGAVRRPVSLEVTLTRTKGSSISARTLDLGTGGMRVSTPRPLGVDEVLTFTLPLGDDGDQVGGRARVLREYASQVYALRFERLGSEAIAQVSSFVLNESKDAHRSRLGST
ncbi:MAG TPA: PilZ domain-containing protein [Solirubrobacteraceae bacterium]|jgi:hypothetical protein|nr:PilZ domain-containing protein [Solirubrobacteraceae bacterium]